MQILISNGTLTQVQETFSASSPYILPTTVTVTGATSSYNDQNGSLTLTAPSQDISVTASGALGVDITTLDYYSTLPKGATYTIKSRALGWGLYTSSNRSAGASYTYPYTITKNITNGSLSGASTLMPSTIAILTFVPDAGYTYPTSVTVTGATASYNNTTGELTLSNATGDVTVTATCLSTAYSITTSITNGGSSGPATINVGGTASITITPSSGYTLPSTVTVTNATSSYNNTTGVISLSNPTGNVTISATCLEMAPTPETSLSGDILTITGSEADSFDLYDNGVLVANIPTATGYSVTLAEGSSGGVPQGSDQITWYYADGTNETWSKLGSGTYEGTKTDVVRITIQDDGTPFEISNATGDFANGQWWTNQPLDITLTQNSSATIDWDV